MNRWKVILVSAMLLIAGGATGAETDHPELDYEKVVVRAYFDDPGLVVELAAEREPWDVNREKKYIVLDVSQNEYDDLLERGFRVEIDEAHTKRMNDALAAMRQPARGGGIPGFPCYRTVPETYASAEALADANPQLASWIDIGDSWEKNNGLGGFDLNVLKITNSAVTGTKPRLMVMAAVHAREYTTAETVTRFGEMLIEEYGIDPDVTWLVDDHEIHLVLQSNPDGRIKAETGISWRKNTNQNYCSPTSNSRGADLNRNWPYGWGCCGGSSGSQCSLTYRGAAPESEPEILAIRTYTASIFPDARGPALTDPAPADTPGIFIDVHSFSELVLWPWGFTSAVAPNGIALQTLGRKLAYFNGYTPEQAIGLYPTDGTSDDYSYGELGVASYAFELGTSFFQSCGTFENTILPDNLDSLMYAARVSRTPYITPAGPDALTVAVAPGAVEPGTAVSLSATIDDTRFNNSLGTEPTQNVAAAEYYIDVPPWGDSPSALAMSAADGSFNASVEGVAATIDTTALANGRHTVYVRGRDAAGNWGAVGAAFLYVVDPATAPRISGTVTAADSGQPLAATVSAGNQFSTATDPADGSYELLVVSGTYDVTASATTPGYGDSTVTGIVAQDSQTVVQDFALQPVCDIFVDNVEAGNAGWSAQAPWAITTELSNSPTRSWTESPGGNYGNNRDVSLTSPSFDLSTFGDVRLEFAQICDTEAGYDYCIVEVSAGGGSWQEVVRYDGSSSQWEDIELALPQLNGQPDARFRFRFTSDAFVVDDGWHVDDVRLRGAGGSCGTPDTDNDGIGDDIDNCTRRPNPGQRDTDGDGIGNFCDPDFDNDCIVTGPDLMTLIADLFQTGDLDTDLSGDGIVNYFDFVLAWQLRGQPPGPSGLSDICD